MNFILRILINGICSYYLISFFPWWCFIFIPFALGLIFSENYLSHFLSGFIGVSVGWLFLILNIDFETNFDFEKISNLFSNLSSFNLFELRNLLNDYKSFGYSTLEIESHLNKLYSLPIYVTIMTILGSLFMLNVKYNKGKKYTGKSS